MDKTFIIAEIGQAHDGSLGIAHSYIDALKDTGINAIKFQTHIAVAESSPFEKFRVKFSYKDKTRFDYWKRMEFNFEEWVSLKKHCEDVGLEFISSPFSCKAVDLLEKLNVNKYKVGSGEVNNLLLINKICETKKEIYLSSGLSSFEEINRTLDFIKKKKNNNKLSIFQCTSKYPTIPEDWRLNLINIMKKKYDLPVGYSDHSGDIYACLSAVNQGASLIEFHVVFDKKMFGPDSSSSLDLSQVRQLVNGVRMIEKSINVKSQSKDFEGIIKMKQLFEKSLCLNKDLQKGHKINIEDLDAKKPKGMGFDANDFQNLIGKKLNKNKKQWSFVKPEDLI